MRTLHWFLAASAIAAGGLGLIVWEDVRGIPSECASRPLERQAANDLTAKIRLINEGASPIVRVCAFTARDQGVKVYDDRLEVPVGAERTFYAALPSGARLLHFEFGTEGTRSNGSPWGECPAKAFEIVVAFSDLGGSADSACIDGIPPGQAVRQGTDGDAPDPFRVSAGVAMASMGSAVLIAALTLRYRAPLAFVFAGFFTRLAKPRLLEQGVRAQIHQIVTQEPGIHTSELQRRLEVGNGHLAHHLRILERERLLSCLGGPFFHHYFVAGKYRPAEMRRLAALRDPSLRLLSLLIRARPGQPLGALATEAQFSKPRASRAAKRLVRAGLATAQRDGRELRLYPAA